MDLNKPRDIMSTHFAEIRDIMINIFVLFSVIDVVNLRLVCKKWSKIIDKRFWRIYGKHRVIEFIKIRAKEINANYELFKMNDICNITKISTLKNIYNDLKLFRFRVMFLMKRADNFNAHFSQKKDIIEKPPKYLIREVADQFIRYN